jgi:hypothetical protein
MRRRTPDPRRGQSAGGAPQRAQSAPRVTPPARGQIPYDFEGVIVEGQWVVTEPQFVVSADEPEGNSIFDALFRERMQRSESAIF